MLYYFLQINNEHTILTNYRKPMKEMRPIVNSGCNAVGYSVVHILHITYRVLVVSCNLPDLHASNLEIGSYLRLLSI